MGDRVSDDEYSDATRPRSSAYTSSPASASVIGRVLSSAVPSFLRANPLYESTSPMGIGGAGDYERLRAAAQSESFGSSVDEEGALNQRLMEARHDESQVPVPQEEDSSDSMRLHRRKLSEILARDKDKDQLVDDHSGVYDIEAGIDREASCSSEKMQVRSENFDFGTEGESITTKSMAEKRLQTDNKDTEELALHGSVSDWEPYSPGRRFSGRNLSPVPEIVQQRSHSSSPAIAIAQQVTRSGTGVRSAPYFPATSELIGREQSADIYKRSSISSTVDENNASMVGGLRQRRAASPREEHASPKSHHPTRMAPTNSLSRLRSRSRLEEPPPPSPLAPTKQNSPLRVDQTNSNPRKSFQRSNTQASTNKVEEEEDDPLKEADLPAKYKKRKFTLWSIIELCAFVVILAALLSSLLVPQFRERTLWGLGLWRWFILVMVVFSGRLVSGWAVRVLVFLIEKNFLLRKRVLYFVFGLRKGVQTCMWLIFVLLSWHFLFDPKVEGSTQSHRALKYVARILVCFVIAAFIWLVKILVVKVMALLYHVSTYFDRIQDSLFNQYILESLSGPPLVQIQQHNQKEQPQRKASGLEGSSTEATHNGIDMSVLRPNAVLTRSAVVGRRGQDSMPTFGESEQEHDITIHHLQKMNQTNVSAWNMKRLINVVKHTGISTLAQTLDETDDGPEDKELNIQSEWQAKAAAKQIFKNVAKADVKYISFDDLLHFLPHDEATKAIALFDGAKETNQISKHALKNWVVSVYKERRSLALSLNDTRTAVNKLHRILDLIVGLLIIIIWLLVLNLATTHLLVFISSQLLLIVFIFGNTCKTVFEAIIFLFAMHPFDVGDRCVIDGVQMVVEEMNVLTTVFLRYDNEKIYYPNSVLSTKPISNFYRSPDMSDVFEFSVHLSTPLEKIAALKDKIASYLASKPQLWYAKFSLVVKEIEDMNRMRMLLGVRHTMNFQDVGERWIRRSDLILEMKKYFEDLSIEYHLLPQDIRLQNAETLTYSQTKAFHT